MEFVRFFQVGGPFMWAILFIMAAGLAITLDRYFYLAKTQKSVNRVWLKLAPMLKAQDYERASQSLTDLKDPLGRILSYGFSRFKGNTRRETVESAMEEGVMEVLPEVEQRTHYLATLANVATLLGLLGTIIGLIQAFTAVAEANPADKAEMLSASISVAMNTTAFGLCAAIPLLLLHSFLSTKAARVVDSIETASVKCLNLMIRE
ncbi:MotA/TolQ/ExbB proton channel family protein [Marinimicrobium sp. C6131]|uniref:MotA/TolQ/ExbB proton channel family protein n=1 Tax=Marinimicrobium sp. C6131 TaxID=3022676 RepID=UPI00223E17B3|nr:MotA/TolQ/ExbB proton channel family protein [Marinimicrobium sp. C6131]UZJ44273.1 MotA/TolQ/ExbB proton channel family protein [Marinimicrobium sp. C6131]